MPGSDGSQRLSSNILSPQSHNPSLDHSEDEAQGQGANGLTSWEICVYHVSSPLLAHAKYISRNCSPRSVWRCWVKLHWELEKLAWKILRETIKGVQGYVWSSQTSSKIFHIILHGWRMFGINQEFVSRKHDLNANVCTWINFMQLCTCKENTACTCTMCPHTLPLCLCYFLLWCNTNNFRGTSFTVATTPIPACLKAPFSPSDDSY